MSLLMMNLLLTTNDHLNNHVKLVELQMAHEIYMVVELMNLFHVQQTQNEKRMERVQNDLMMEQVNILHLWMVERMNDNFVERIPLNQFDLVNVDFPIMHRHIVILYHDTMNKRFSLF
jgi:hypothetical protein